jgi:hypothetical protein
MIANTPRCPPRCPPSSRKLENHRSVRSRGLRKSLRRHRLTQTTRLYFDEI